jgi:hypothetical protein
MTDLRTPGRGAPALYSNFVITGSKWHHIGLLSDGSHRVLYGGMNHPKTPFSREKRGQCGFSRYIPLQQPIIQIHVVTTGFWVI